MGLYTPLFDVNLFSINFYYINNNNIALIGFLITYNLASCCFITDSNNLFILLYGQLCAQNTYTYNCECLVYKFITTYIVV